MFFEVRVSYFFEVGLVFVEVYAGVGVDFDYYFVFFFGFGGVVESVSYRMAFVSRGLT